MTKEEYRSWLDHPITKEYFTEFSRLRDEAVMNCRFATKGGEIASAAYWHGVASGHEDLLNGPEEFEQDGG